MRMSTPMHEIKFQVFDFERDFMWGWELLKLRGDLGLILEGQVPGMSPPLQYICREDVVFKEIYVGDVVEGDHKFIEGKKEIGAVACTGDFPLYALRVDGKKMGFFYLPFSAFKSLKKLGNIYENPELLEERSDED